jgi:copper chaperone CopZ
MDKLTLDLPAMYGDHHVSEVRRILLELPGVQSVYASSAFQVAEITYEPAQIDSAAITARLDKAGYLGDLSTPSETGQPAASPEERSSALRHTVAYQQTGKVVGFAQNVGRDARSRVSTGRALWPCPGMETLKEKEWRDGEES